MNFISDNLTEIIIAIVGLLAIGITIRIIIKKGGNNKAIQKGNKVKGHMSGRDTIIGKQDGDK